MEIDKAKLMAAIKADSQQSSRRTSDDLSALEKNLVRGFFAKIEVIYGKGRCASVWPDEDALRASMREWALDILQYDEMALRRKLKMVKAQMGIDKRYQFPDISSILRIDHQPGQGGQAAASYRPASDVMALPTPKAKREAGQKAIADAKRALDEATDAHREEAQKRRKEELAELRRLEDKHVAYGSYLRAGEDQDGNTIYANTKIKHPFSSIAKGIHHE